MVDEHDGGRVLYHVTMSLDGFIAGPDDAMDWVFSYPGPNPVADEVVGSIGAALIGRRSVGVEDRDRGGLYGGAWTGPQFVLTHEPLDDPSFTVVSGDIAGAVATALAAAEGKYLVLIGADVARQCLAAGLVDEILVHVAPLLLGDGVRFFDGPGGDRVNLEPLSVSRAGQTTNLRFRVLR